MLFRKSCMKNFANELLSNLLGKRDYFNDSIKPINSSVYIKRNLAKLLGDYGIALKFKPIISLNDNKVYGMEFYICWNRAPSLFLNLTVDDFLEMHDKYDLFLPMETWILEAALEQATIWKKMYRQLVVVVNVSSNQLLDQEFVKNVRAISEAACFPSELIEFEISESKLIRNPNKIDVLMNSFLDQGFSLCVDQFGLSSFSNKILENKALKKVKFSSRLVSLLLSDDVISNHIKCISDLAAYKKIQLAADGITSKSIAEKARSLGCSFGQGYYFGEPLAASEFTKLLENTNASAKFC